MKKGQAMIEFTVALVAIMVLFAGLIQFSYLGFIHSRTMNNARSEAGNLALLDIPTFSGPDYIYDRTVGGDGFRYTRDDGYSAANPADLTVHLISHSRPDDLDTQVSGNAVSALNGN